ncbi:MFS transporter [Sediminitomix flava]|uniref:MFS transporter n=1 Tax=Sediminitomix flava TaxID=379075 RepID=A0A315ZIQ8_SEDFL|nr:MFS transporter [Sediminitomix flava]PWJ44980.1 MFS transporter [Sediminitomix flava]
MNKQLLRELKAKPMYSFLVLLCVASALGFQGWRTLFNNFAVNEVGLDGLQIGSIQSFREVPGFLALTAIFVLLFIREDRFASISTFVMGVGVMLTGLFPSFEGMMATTFIMSVGFHYFETANQSLSLQYFDKQQSPFVLANLKSVMAITNISVGAVIYFLSKYTNFESLYLLIGGAVLILVTWAFFKDPVDKTMIPQHKKMILKKRYWLFYVLNLLSGARRQVFVVFAVLLLVEKYEYSLQEISILFVVNNIISIFFNPVIAKMINRFGERKTLSFEYISLSIIFLAYAFIENRWVAGGLYILDHVFFNFSIAIKTYFQKNADPKDIAPSMAVGFTINHIAAVFLPVLGGYMWLQDWRIPFLGAFGLCLISLFFSQFVKEKTPSPTQKLEKA